MLDKLTDGMLSGIGSLVSSAASFRNAQTNRRFQANMSNTAYSRAMADMRRAGLNPILAGKFGGMSTPMGAQVNIGNPGLAYAQGNQMGASASQLQQQTRIIKQNADYLQKNGISELSLKHTVKNIQGTKAAEAFEELFANGGNIPLMPNPNKKAHYEAAQAFLDIMENQGYIARGKGGAFSRKGYYFTEKAKNASPDMMRMIGSYMFGVYGNMALGAGDSFFGIGD